MTTNRGPLETRVAHLESRLARLEAAIGVAPGASVESPRPSLAVAPSVPATPSVEAIGPAQWQAEDLKPGASSGRPFSIWLPDLSGSLDELEARLAGRLLAWVGGAALVLGAIFFLSLAFSRGWIGPELRVVMGLVAGAVGLAGGAAFLERGNRLLGLVLIPVGLAITSISLVAATRLYGLVPVELGLVGALASAVAAAVIAIRASSQIVAAFGLVTVLVAPPIMGASPDILTLLFVGTVLVGTTGIALWRSWSWLPPVAFVLSAPQAAVWIAGDPLPLVGLVGIGAFWLLNVIAAGGEEFRRHRDDLRPSSSTVLLANVAFIIWAGFSLLSGDLQTYQGFFLLLVALAQFLVGGFFVVRDGERNLFGLLAIGTGLAALTMAAPIQLGAPAVPVAWSAEAVALAWVAIRRGHPYSALASALLYFLAGACLLVLYGRPIASTSGVPFVDGHGAALAFFAAAVAAGVWIARDRSLRSGLASFGLVVVARCALVALDEPASVIALTILGVVGIATWRLLPLLPGAPIGWQIQGLIPRSLATIGGWRPRLDRLLPLTTAVLTALATWYLVSPVYGSLVLFGTRGVPFVNPAGGALMVYLAGLAVVAWVSGRSRLREPLAAVGLLVTARACLAEFGGVALVAAWAGLMVVGLAIARGLTGLLPEPRTFLQTDRRAIRTLHRVLPYAALLSGILAAIHVLFDELPVDRFGSARPPAVPFTDDGAVSAVILATAALAGGALVGGPFARRASLLVAGAVAAYAIPFEVLAWAVSALWVGLAGLALVMVRVDPQGRRPFLLASGSLVVAAAVVAVGPVAPPSDLVVGHVAMSPIGLLERIASLGAVGAGFIALAASGRTERWGSPAWIAAGITAVYLLSIGVVGVVATQVGGAVATDELRTQGQVALSVLWAVLGLVGFVAGLRLHLDHLRHGGLALLALATAKVFLFDLSALDVAYRVISLVALGLLLLVGAWLWQRLAPRAPAASGTTDPSVDAAGTGPA